MLLHYLHINNKSLRPCCQDDMKAKVGYVSRLGESSSKGKAVKT